MLETAATFASAETMKILASMATKLFKAVEAEGLGERLIAVFWQARMNSPCHNVAQWGEQRDAFRHLLDAVARGHPQGRRTSSVPLLPASSC